MSRLQEALRPVSARMSATRPEAIDITVGAVIALAGLAQVASNPGGVVPITLTVVALAALAAGLWWRRSQPLAVAFAAVAVVVIADALGGHGMRSTAALVAYLLIVYSVAAHTGRRSAVIGLVALTAGSFADELISPDAQGFSPIYPLVTCIPPWVVGRVLAARRGLSRDLADRAGELEHERAQLVVLAVSGERARIARELHDVVAHCVSLIVIQAAAGQRVVSGDPSAASRAFDAIIDSGDQALVELVSMVGLLDGLRADASISEPGLAHVGGLVLHAEQAGMRIALTIEGGRSLPPAVDAAAFRIVQEGLTNSLRHAGPGDVTVSVRRLRDLLVVEVSDAGRVAPTATLGGGHGLQGARERVELLGGTLRAGPGDRDGWTVRASFPLTDATHPPALTPSAASV